MITGFHSETTESELLKEMINEIGMDFGSARIECSGNSIIPAFIHFMNDGERNKFISSANMFKKELRGRKVKNNEINGCPRKIPQQQNGICQILHPYETQHSSQPDLPEVDRETRVSQRTDCGKTCQNGSLKFSKYQDVEDEEQMQKWQPKNSSQRL